MLRVVLAVLLAAAVVGAAGPAVESARVGSAEARIAAELGDIERAAVTLAERNEAGPGGRTARRVLSVQFPERTWGQAGTRYVRIEPAVTAPVTWRAESGARHGRQVERLVGPDGGLRLDGGRIRLSLSLRRDGTVVVRRFYNRCREQAAPCVDSGAGSRETVGLAAWLAAVAVNQPSRTTG
ncbi:MAG: hypothetical protein ABEH56_00875 [Salinirussus sp.]